MRVLLLVTSLNMGGAEMQVTTLALGLRATGLEVLVVSMIEPAYFLDDLRSKSIQVESLGMAPGRPTISGVIKALNIVKAWRPDILHSHMLHANLLGGVVRTLSPISFKLITTAHNTDEFHGNRLLQLLNRYTNKYSSYCTNVSNAGVSRYRELRVFEECNSACVYNGIDIERFSPTVNAGKPPDTDYGEKFVWLTAGRLTKQKNYPNLLHAIRILKDSSSRDFIVLIAGEGELLNELNILAQSLQIEDYIRFLGVRKDMPNLMWQAQGFVLSSSWEGLPLVIIESLLSECVVTATDVGGIGEILTNLRTARLVKPDTAEDLAKSMEDLMRLRPTLENDGELANTRRQIAHKFSMQKTIETWVNIYNKAMQD